jgi:Helix-turn-helix of DDE superfamily endonuclease
MSLYETYKTKKPAEFTRQVGVSFGTFQVILGRLKIALERRLELKPMRRHGRKSSLAMADQLLLTLIYLRQYHTFLSLGELFGISESYAQKRYTFIVERLLEGLPIPNDKALVLANLIVAMDVSEQPLERPLQNQKKYYSGKKNSIPSRFC